MDPKRSAAMAAILEFSQMNTSRRATPTRRATQESAQRQMQGRAAGCARSVDVIGRFMHSAGSANSLTVTPSRAQRSKIVIAYRKIRGFPADRYLCDVP